MAKGKKKQDSWTGLLWSIPAIASRDDLADHLTTTAPSLCELIEHALSDENPVTREAAKVVTHDLWMLFHAAASALKGERIRLQEDDYGTVRADHALSLSRLLIIEEPGEV